MTKLDIGQATTTDLTNVVEDVTVATQSLDSSSPDQKETTWDFPNAAQDLGYFKDISELRSSIIALSIWVAGKGVTTDVRTKVILDNITGWGEDSFQSIMEGMIQSKKALGDAMAEIIRNKQTGTLLNLKPLYIGDMSTVADRNGIILRYEQRTKTKNIILQPNQVLHLVNDRFANEIHGTPVTDAVRVIINAKNEALSDEKKIRHRELALGVLYIDTENTAKRNLIIAQYAQAVKNGEVLVLPKDTAELKDVTAKPRDRIAWLQYLDNAFYRVVGIPRVIVEADASEAASKVGFLTFDPTYTREQTLLEQDLWNQMAIRVKFNRPPSLTGIMQESEAKNTGQTGFQPNEVQVSAGRTE